MKKILLALMASCLVLCLVSCDAESAAKIAGYMGKMGENVYGLTPDMSDVNGASASISEAVGDDGHVEFKEGFADELVSNIGEIANSSQKKEALKEELSKPVTDDPEKAAQVKSDLQGKMGDIISAVPDPTTIENETAKQVVETVSGILNSIRDNISDKPTQADLASVAIVTDLVSKATELASSLEGGAEPDMEELLEVAGNALQAVEALKVTANMDDLLEGFSISSLLSGAADKDLAKDDLVPPEEFATYMAMLEDVIAKMVSNMTDAEGAFDENNYKSFVTRAGSLKVAYDISVSAANPYSHVYDFMAFIQDGGDNLFAELDAYQAGKLDYSFNDAVIYLMSYVVTALPQSFMEALIEDPAAIAELELDELLGSVTPSELIKAVNTVGVILKESGYFGVLESIVEEGKTFGQVITAAFVEMM